MNILIEIFLTVPFAAITMLTLAGLAIVLILDTVLRRKKAAPAREHHCYACHHNTVHEAEDA